MELDKSNRSRFRLELLRLLYNIPIASQTFENILEQIQGSHLNFQIQISPFSALISLKKSLITDKSGVPLLPPSSPDHASSKEIATLATKNIMLEKKLNSLQRDYENAVDDSDAAHRTIKSLEKELIKMEANHDLAEELLEKNFETQQLRQENNNLKIKIETQNEDISTLETSNKIQKDINDKLHKELNETKIRFKKEQDTILKQHKAETKSWRKDLGDVTEGKIKLDEKFHKNVKELAKSTPAITDTISESYDPQVQGTLCSICGIPMNTSSSVPMQINFSLDEDLSNSMVESLPLPSMISNWIPLTYNCLKRPGDITSMISHCALLPGPGSSFVSMEEVLEDMEKVFERHFKKWKI